MSHQSLARTIALASSLIGGLLIAVMGLADYFDLSQNPSRIGPLQLIGLMAGGLLLMSGTFTLWALASWDHDLSRRWPVIMAASGLFVFSLTAAAPLLSWRDESSPPQEGLIAASPPPQGTRIPGTLILEQGEAYFPSSLPVTVKPVVGSLESPIGIANAGDGSHRLFIVEKRGTIRVIQNQKLIDQPFLDIRDRVLAGGLEQGLLGLTFDPGYAQNGLFYVNYTDRQGDTVIARYRLGTARNRADPDSEVIILKLDQPTPIHNGGHLAFGADGYLYVAVGDGGDMNDSHSNGQNGLTLLGSILRLDVSQLPYAIPPDNPFVDHPEVQNEIWVWGLRNPWRFSFDPATGDLYIGDVGEANYEEINRQRLGDTHTRNYGWPVMEGFECTLEAACEAEGFAPPLVVYDHHQGCAVTAGYVYRGRRIPSLRGTYLFADYCIGRLWGIGASPHNSAQVRYRDLNLQGVASFGEDETGEIFLVSLSKGVLYQLVAEEP